MCHDGVVPQDGVVPIEFHWNMMDSVTWGVLVHTPSILVLILAGLTDPDAAPPPHFASLPSIMQ